MCLNRFGSRTPERNGAEWWWSRRVRVAAPRVKRETCHWIWIVTVIIVLRSWWVGHIVRIRWIKWTNIENGEASNFIDVLNWVWLTQIVKVQILRENNKNSENKLFWIVVLNLIFRTTSLIYLLHCNFKWTGHEKCWPCQMTGTSECVM